MDVVGVGTLLIDRIHTVSNIPDIDNTAMIMDCNEYLGGVATNNAVALHQWGYKCGIIGKVGKDEIGEKILEKISEYDVDISRVKISEKSKTTVGMVFMNKSGERIIFAAGDSTRNLNLTSGDLDYAFDADVIITSAYLPSMVIESIVKNKSSESKLVFDLSTTFDDLKHRGYTRASFANMWSDIDILISNQDSICSLFCIDNIKKAIRAIQQSKLKTSVITKGAHGSIILHEGEIIEIPAYDVDVKDTLGAGDAYTAGIIHAHLLNHYSIEKAGHFASAAAAMNCTARGGCENLPDIDAVHALVDQKNWS
jgi:ribokinase/sulfofructose kinase